jgi:hypothetical protein
MAASNLGYGHNGQLQGSDKPGQRKWRLIVSGMGSYREAISPGNGKGGKHSFALSEQQLNQQRVRLAEIMEECGFEYGQQIDSAEPRQRKRRLVTLCVSNDEQL